MADETYAIREDCDTELVDRLINGYPCSPGDRGKLESACTRYAFSRMAASIAEDRYSAGSTAAKLTTIILLKFGPQAAINFADDVDHHER